MPDELADLLLGLDPWIQLLLSIELIPGDVQSGLGLCHVGPRFSQLNTLQQGQYLPFLDLVTRTNLDFGDLTRD